ncbi:heavy metal translocating P-type ATPase [Paenibacillus nasutitermitis]|uniref:P-type Cu(+) transporter n=1 Tax=Paenibacillus nasutitermitis TaxID=1652958 RepID=A0A916YZR1_9BACL|nr:heavy metal translocating P-type ATPase [Paenibacillus nasutitermitis]GGD67589.1 copper-translocating P-type ATPase [Paenibacillus nasutitermitis]
MHNQETEHVLDLRIEGMNCSACAVRIEKAVGKMKGVSGVSVHYAGKSANIRITEDQVSSDAIMDRITQLGFQAYPFGEERSGLSERNALRLRFVIAAVLTFPLLWSMAHHYSWLGLWPVPAFLQEPLLQFALAALIQFFVGMPFYFGAYHALRERTATMDVLVAIGTTAAFGYSYYAMMTGKPLYFETSAIVITAVLLGKLLEAAASEKVMKEGEAFEQLKARSAVIVRGGIREKVALEQIRTGERMLSEAGIPLPADGIVLEGEAEADESFLTGESIPVHKKAGDEVFAGTTVTASGLLIRITAVGKDTLLSRIAALTRQAQSTKSTIGRRVDRLAAIFVPVMLGLSVFTLLLWLFVLRPGDTGSAGIYALAVLLAACPCALGLAAPISLVLASGKLARRGIVLQEAGALERLAQMNVIVLDKTGTITEGKPSITGVFPLRGSRNALLQLAAAAEFQAVHPFAAAIRNAAQREGLSVSPAETCQAVPGKGIAAIVEGEQVQIGNAAYAAEAGWQISPSTGLFAGQREAAGETVIYVFRSGICEGAIALADPVKRSAPEAVHLLQAAGISVMLATGDYSPAAGHAASEAGITQIHSSMLPEHKAELIRKLQQEGLVVGMAGDGWNDAPALAAAHIGIAMGSGTNAALEAGHLTLLRPRLTGIYEALIVSRLTVRNIRQNLGFAFLYNMVVIPFAALGGLAPWMAGTAMALSSVSVVGNALRLNGQMNRALRKQGEGRQKGPMPHRTFM